jgi:hypothetical protein
MRPVWPTRWADIANAVSEPADALRCGNCRGSMRRLLLQGHYGRQVEIDICPPCHLLWFDSLESVRLSGPGMLSLIGDLAAGQREAHRLLSSDARCPRCAGALKTIQNRSRWGPTTQLECLRGHGAYQTFAQYLSEKGLIRAMSSADRAVLAVREQGLHCLNCGGAIAVQDERCRFCEGVPGMFDVARLARALDPEGATESHAVHGNRAQHTALSCLACGAHLPPGQSVSCPQCASTLAVGRLSEAHRAVSVLDAALRAHAQTPAAHVRSRRLAALDGDLSRRREWVRGMEAQTMSDGVSDDRGFWDDLRENPLAFAGLAVFLISLWMLLA